MDIKKILIFSILLISSFGCIGSVNAGWFDFLNSDMTEYDFGNFTMEIPKNTTLNESIQPNNDDVIYTIGEKSPNGTISINYSDSKWNAPQYKKYFHPCWNGENKIVIEYIEYGEDNLTQSNLMSVLYPDSTLNNTEGNVSSYEWSSFDTYIVVKYDDKSAVLIRSDNPDLTWQMVDSLKFK